jgi:hypothetical protein
MKKSCLLTTLLSLIFASQTALALAENAVITHSQGAPVIQRNGQEIAAANGTACQANDILKTADGCLLDLSLNNKAGCRILPGSEVLLVSSANTDMQVQVVSGNVILNIDKLKGSTFKVESPTAIAAVRGTQFWGRVMGPADSPVTTFAVREGAVEVFAKAQGKTYTVNAGEAIDIPKDGTSIPVVRPALAEELLAMEQASAIKTSA